MVMACNKYDLIANREPNEIDEFQNTEHLEEYSKFLGFSKMFVTSAKTGHHVNDLFDHLITQIFNSRL